MVDALGDHALACPRTGLLARRGKIVERAWVRVAREAVGAEGQVVPQQWLAHTRPPQTLPRTSTSLSMVPLPTEACSAAMRPSCHPLHARVTRSPAPSRLMGRC